MNIRVNLIPAAIARKATERRQRRAAAGALVALVALMGAGQVVQLGRVSAAQDALAVEQDTLTVLQASQRELGEFAELDTRRNQTNETVQTLLGGQIGMAGILQDLAAVLPADAALTELSVLADPTELGSVGTITASAVSLQGHAPGVERVLINLEKVAAFRDLYVASSALDDAVGLTTFRFDFRLGVEVLSGRYLGGIPEVLR